jgi:hypothetical protein
MRAIFISYRRDDAEGQAGRLFDDLVAHFGKDLVFMDVAGIEPGRDFRKVIDENVAACGVLLSILGRGWLDAKDDTGRRRLDDPLDFVRLETASALKRDIPVVPVLVQGAKMPRAEQLPDDLKDLAYRNGVELTHARWDSDLQVLIKALERLAAQAPTTQPQVPAMSPVIAREPILTKQPVVPPKTPQPAPPSPKRAGKFLVPTLLIGLVLGAGAFAAYQYRQRAVAEALQAKQAAETAVAEKAAAAAREDAEKSAAERAKAERIAAQERAAQEASDRQAAADRAAANRAEAERQAAEKRAAAQRAEAERQAAEKRANDARPSVTVNQVSCSSQGGGRFAISLAGTAHSPAGLDYFLHVEVLLSQSGLRYRPVCSNWQPGQAGDGGMWEFSCIHHANQDPDTTWQLRTIVNSPDNQPPHGGGVSLNLAQGKKSTLIYAPYTLNCR